MAIRKVQEDQLISSLVSAIDLNRRRITNAAPSQDAHDYVIQEEIGKVLKGTQVFTLQTFNTDIDAVAAGLKVGNLYVTPDGIVRMIMP